MEHTNARSRTLLVALGSILITVAAAATAAADTINLAWDPNRESTVQGYIVHVGTQSGTYTQHIDVGLNTSYGWPSAVAGQRYCFAVSAYVAGHLEGPKSNEVCGFSNAPPVLANPGGRSSVVGQPTSLQLQGSDPDGEAVSYTANGMPPGLSLGVGTGFISGTPTSAGTFSVTATISDGVLQASQTFTWTITAAGDSTSPLVTITGPTPAATFTTTSSTLSLSGTASDNVAVTQVTWVNNRGGNGVASGTTNWSIGGITLASNSNVITVTARDAAGNVATDVITVTSTTGTTTNTAPVVNGGADQTITLSASATLAGTATDDGLPTPAKLTPAWSKVSGPGTVTFGNAAVLTTSATFSAAGVYVLRLSVSDGAATTSDDVTITVTAGSSGGGTGENGLVAAYSFDAGAGTMIADSSGNGNNGTASSTATWSAGKFGNAMRFNGTSTIVTVPDSALLDLTTAMTVEAWVMPAVAQTGWRTVLHKNVDRFYLFVSGGGDAPATGGTFGSGNQNTLAPSALPVNVWSHLAGTFDGKTVKLYIDGQLVASQPQGTPLTTSTGTLQIGGSSYGEFFNGWIDEIRIYNRALSDVEIQTTMTTPVQTPPTDTASPMVTITGPTSAATHTTTASTITLAGTASDDVGVTQVTWVNNRGGSGTATGTTSWSINGIVLAANANTITVSARDAAGNTATDVITVTSNSVTLPPSNTAPAVNAGADKTVTLPSSVTLAGIANDDGQPTPSALTAVWSKVSGPGTVTFGNSAALITSATFSAAGAYVLRLSVSDGALTSSDDLTVTVNTTTTSGAGLRGEYFSGTAFGSLLVTRVDPTVNFNWSSGTPGSGLPADNFSVRWTGDVIAPVTGTYTFTTVSDDGVRLWVNNQQVIGNWSNHAAATDTSAGITLQAGQHYPIRLEYYEAGGLSEIRLQWSYPGQATQAIPQSALSPTSGGTVPDPTPTPTPSGLVAAYSFNASAGTTVADSSGIGNHGTANSTATWSSGKFGGAMRFNGTDSVVTVPDSASLDLTTAMTVEAWVMPAVAQTGWRTVLHKNVDRFYLFVSGGGGTPATGGTFGSGNQNTLAPSALPVNVWSHLAGTFDGKTVTLYINGQLVASQPQSTPLTTSTGTLQIGGSSYGEFFNGWIDEIRIYNRALSAAEIQSTMNAPVQ